MPDSPQILVGRVVKKIENPRGGFYIVLAEGANSRRFRADACLFRGELPQNSIISFVAESSPRRANNLPRVRKIVSAPNPENPPAESKQ